MAVIFSNVTPLKHLSARVSAPALRQALRHIFSQVSDGVWLVGGTALAGYYAEHRRSDDLDLFAKDGFAFKSLVAAVKSLQKEKAIFSDERSSASFYHVLCQFAGHQFTIDAVLDENLHRIGKAWKDTDGVFVADLETLLIMKMGTLISRVSEKDLFDLTWLFEHMENPDVAELIQRASQIDGGIVPETLLYTLSATTPREDACHFTLPHDVLKPKDVLKKIQHFKKQLIQKIYVLENEAPLSEAAEALNETVTDLKKMKS
jgi:hypothetical protein